MKAAQMVAEEVRQVDSDPGWITKGETLTIYTDNQATVKALDAIQVKSQLVKETIDTLNNLSNLLGTPVTISWVKGHAKCIGNIAADWAAAEADKMEEEEPDSPELPKAILHTEVDAAATQMWRNIWDNTLGHRQTRYWFPDGPDPQFAFDIIKLPKLICSQVVAFITGHCHLNRHQALIDDAETEQIRKHVGNEDEDGNSIIPPADPTCSMCKYDPSQANKEETPLHLMTECVGLKDLRRKVFGAYNPVPPFKFPVFQIVAFLKEAKIPSFPMQPFLEELFPTAPTGVPDPDPVPDPQPSPQNPPPSPDTEVTGGAHPGRQIDDPEISSYPEGDKWFHTYLYISNPPLKPHQEKRLLEKPHMRPLRY